MSETSEGIDRLSALREGYDHLVRSTRTYRERLVVRLAGEAGLRPGEMCRLRPGDVTGHVAGGRVHYLVRVRDDEGDTVRMAHLPAGLERELARYAASNGIDEDDPLFDVTPRRLQMLVGEVADTAATDGDDRLRAVSTADLRRRFGRWLLERGVEPGVVMAVGGWRRLDALAPDADPDPDPASVAAAFARATDSGDDRFRAAFDRLDHPVALLDDGGSVDHANRRFASLVDVDRLDGLDVRRLVTPIDATWEELWEASLAGETWVGEATVGAGDDRTDSTAGRVTLTAVTAARGRSDGFLLTVHPEESGAPGGSDLGRLRAVQDAAAAVDTAVDGVATEDAVFRVACETLAAADPFEFAWVCRAEADGLGTPAESSGIDPEAVERLHSGTEVEWDDGGSPPEEVTAAAVDRETGEPSWLVRIPLRHDGSADGVLVVGTPGPPSPAERAALGNLGGRVAGAVAAAEWKRLLLADQLLELEFRTDDQRSLFVAGSAELDCSFTVVGLVPLDGGSLLFYVTVSGAPPNEVLSFTREAASGARLVADHREESVLEVTVDEESVAGNVVEYGANVRELVAEDGHARLRCEVAPSADVREIAEHVKAGSPSATLVAKREVEPSVRSPTEFQRSLDGQLTDRQRSVLQAAYHAGYFDWPRGSTAEDLADSIGVSSPTLHNHLRRGQRKLLATFFDDAE
jgi:hypothetical protein